MKTILLLHDEARRPTQLVAKRGACQAARSAKPKLSPACNCDRWGHPCPGCVERIAQPAPELPISMPTKK